MERKPLQTAQASAEDSQSASRELRRLIAVVKRAIFNWQPSAAIVALGLVLGVTIALTKKPTYKSETIILYRQGVRFGEEGGGRVLSLGTRLSEMLLARNRLEKMLDEQGIYQDIKTRGGYVDAVEEFRKDIVWDAKATDTFSISYKGSDPKVVQKVTERLADSLIEENQRIRIEQSRVQSEFMSTEKTRSETDLKAKELELAKFLADHPEFALDQAMGKEGASIRAQAQADKVGDPRAPRARATSSAQPLGAHRADRGAERCVHCARPRARGQALRCPAIPLRSPGEPRRDEGEVHRAAPRRAVRPGAIVRSAVRGDGGRG